MVVELRVTMETEEDVKVLRRLADVLEKELGAGEEVKHQQTWTEGAFIQYWDGLPGSNWRGLKPDAKRAFREISKKPDGYSADKLLEALGVSGATLGGNLSSMGFGMNYFPEYEWPVDRRDGIYYMAPEVAEIIQRRGL